MTLVSGATSGATSGAASGAPPVTGLDLKGALLRMVREGASDLHLKVGRPPTLRLHGDLIPLDMPPMRPEQLRTLAEQLLPPAQLREFVEARESDFAISVPGVGRFRVNVYQQRGTVAFAMRAIAHAASSIRDLNLPPVLEQIAMRPRGLVLVTGVTGSGKSTALAAMIQLINQRRSANIITIEDPIEFVHRDVRCHINQREVGTDTESFSQSLRRVLRQDPDVIMIGEIRDLETLEVALKAAGTGHLVFSTLHTTDATLTINRVLSFYPPHQQNEVRFALASALSAVVSLRLLPRADQPGRVPACEILVNTEAVRDQIRDLSATLNIPDLIKEGSVAYGMQSFDQSLMSWYTRGVISYESALFNASNPAEFALRVQGVDGASDTAFSGFRPGSNAA
ncbi:MAG: type IV pilus twitching motility protein PilT [Gemmatimonas sp.]|jgi:twitching motility protein PilT|uniref:type IV pilus twitching motility protein PilT n=1 Tax=Gemmatimonas sp. TaxID=1962908 RepID=UPI00391F1C71|nr:type IV pilus twitching motility protein PilT [Gemmatimonadota bacterium]